MIKRKGMSRRRFIKRAFGTAAASVTIPYIVPSSALGGSGVAAPSDRITLGFIGTGKQSKHLMRSFLNSPGTHVVAGCDVDKLKLERGKKLSKTTMPARMAAHIRAAIRTAIFASCLPGTTSMRS